MEDPKNHVGPPSSKRRSKRTRSVSHHESKPPGNGMKLKKKKTSNKKPVAAAAAVQTKEIQVYQPNLLSLPDAVQVELLKYLAVDTLLILAETCSYYNQLINGRFLTDLSLPFEKDFLQELKEARTIEKKPLLRLESTKPRKLMWELDINSSLYILQYQMALLDLHRVREVYLVPRGIYPGIEDMWKSSGDMELFKALDLILLREISALGLLGNISRLDILILDEDFGRTVLEEFMPALNNLLEFRVSVAEPKYSIKAFYDTLEKIVSANRAPLFKLDVLSDGQNPKTRKPKVFSNDYIEKIVVSGPCNFYLELKMKNLREVVLGDLPGAYHNGESCSLKRKIEFDRKMHIPGCCVLHIGSTYKTCPKLEKFDDVKTISQRGTSFASWMKKLAKPFYKAYLQDGGEETFKRWLKTRWRPRL